MNAASALNFAHAHSWADAAAGTAGEAHRFEAGGKLRAEKSFDPLIIWASSEGKENTWAGTVLSTLTTLSSSPPGGDGYKVRVRTYLGLGILPYPSYWGTDGRATANSLVLEREGWTVKRYRRAVMGGAGVYQMGLWALLNHRTPASTQRYWKTSLETINTAETYWTCPISFKQYEGVYVLPREWGYAGRKSKQKALVWSRWKLSPWGRSGLTRWKGRAVGALSRLTLAPGVWAAATHAGKVHHRPVSVSSGNSLSEYLAKIDRATLNRIRHNSPRWRGTATHRRETGMLARIASTGRGWVWNDKHAWKTPAARSLATYYEREVKKTGGPRAWAEKMAAMLEASKYAPAMRREVDKRLRAFAVYSRHTLAQILLSFKALRTFVSPALALFLELAHAAYREACKLGRAARPRRLPRPHRPLHTFPRPPSAPLAPPVI